MRTQLIGAAVLGATLPLALDVRIARSLEPPSRAWQHEPITPRGTTLLGLSFRPPQCVAFGLELRPSLQRLLDYPFQVIRLGAYWNQIELSSTPTPTPTPAPAPAPAAFDPAELDWQVEAASQAGKRIVLSVGALKNFGYPELFIPRHRLARPLPERTLIQPSAYPDLLQAACAFVRRIVERYQDNPSIVAWQVEHEAVDPLGLEHSWRLARQFVAAEVDAVRQVDAARRPILMNGFLPASTAVALSQWWQTRDQGDSLAVAQDLADIVGLDYYPRSALFALGAHTAYLDGGAYAWHQRRAERIFAWARQHGRRLMVSEGQAEPWEAVTVPPNVPERVPHSCTPLDMIQTYNRCMQWSRGGPALDAYLFWGAEYWLLRERAGDPSYLQAFARILDATRARA
jgi:hypothetical protein